MNYILIAVIVILLIIFVYKESSGYNIVEYELTTDKDIGSPVRFVMLSDLHDTDVSHDHNEKLFRSIMDQSPEFVILAGDMITSYTSDSYGHVNSFGLMKKLAASLPVYYGLGNHEQRYKEEPEKFEGRYDHLIEFTKEARIRVLSDDHADIEDRNIRIYGFDIPIEKYRRVVSSKLSESLLEKTLGQLPDDKYNILIAHNPEFFEEYSNFGPDLVLSGHLHGGVVAVPGIGGVISPQLKLFPKYDFGTFSRKKTTMIVSRGIGWHSIPIRIFNKAEIVSVTIKQNRGDSNGDQR